MSKGRLVRYEEIRGDVPDPLLPVCNAHIMNKDSRSSVYLNLWFSL